MWNLKGKLKEKKLQIEFLIAPSCIVEPEGGKELVEESIRCINEVFK